MDESMALSFDPFAGDFGDVGDRTLRDKICCARKEGECSTCAQVIQPGERIRSRVDIVDGEMQAYRWCQACCEAMATDDGGEAYEGRIQMRSTLGEPDDAK